METGIHPHPHHRLPLNAPEQARTEVPKNRDNHFDLLDRVSAEFYKGRDVRRYDYPQNFGFALNDSEMQEYLQDADIIQADHTMDLFQFSEAEKLWYAERYFLDDELYQKLKTLKNDTAMTEALAAKYRFSPDKYLTARQVRRILAQKNK